MGSARRGLGLLVAVGSVMPMPVMSLGLEVEVYPNRPITLVVGFPPGDGSDVVARHLAVALTDELGQRVIIENRPGAAGNVAAASVSRATADGYTFFLAVRPVALHKALYRKIDYDFPRDFVPVGMVVRVPYVLVVSKHLGEGSLPELFSLATATPGKFTCASGGIGTTAHLLCETMREKMGLPLLHVPYNGGVPALRDLVGGRVDFAVASVPAALPFIRADNVRAMAAFASGRVPAISSVPAIGEHGYADMKAQGWCAVVAPTGTPSHAITRLNRAINAAMSTPKLRQAIVDAGYVLPDPNTTPEALEEFMEEDTNKWTALLEQQKITGLQ